jgi:hypothetical protein
VGVSPLQLVNLHRNRRYFIQIYPVSEAHGKKMHVKEIYVIFIHLFDSGILLIIDLRKKKGGRGVNFICEIYS